MRLTLRRNQVETKDFTTKDAKCTKFKKTFSGAFVSSVNFAVNKVRIPKSVAIGHNRGSQLATSAQF